MAKTNPMPAPPYSLTVPELGTFEGSEIAEVRALFEAARDASGLGVSAIGGEWPLRCSGVVVGRMSYNGRFWPKEKP